MADLKHMQGLFQRAVVGNVMGNVMGNDADFLSQIEDGGKITPARRLGIYQHAYKARLRGILEEDFPVMHSMLGDEVFYGLCNDYIDAHPSVHPSLRYFGQHLEEYVSRKLPYSNQPVIIEMARFEWAFHDVFDAADHACVTIEDVGALDPAVWTTLRFEFHPSLYRAAYDWNVAAVWSSVQADDDPTLPVKMPQTSHVIQWRHDLRSYFRTLNSDEARALSLAWDGKPFPEICECLVQDHGEQAPMRAAELLKGWVLEGLVCGLLHMDMEV